MKEPVPLRPRPPKRNDIQILRAYSVVTVLMFHLRPNWVPNGFLAVDIFFVISGYLMAKLLHFGAPDQHLTLAGTLNFYNRRFKRLVPTYIFVILVTVIIGQKFLFSVDFKGLSTDALWALGFASNIQTMVKTEDYFKMTSEFYFLLHSWSLSVEAQYYLLSPFLFALLSIKWPLYGLVFTTGASMALQSVFVNDTIGFNFVFCRIWQFLMGAIVFYTGERQSSLNGATSKLLVARVVLVGCTLMPKFIENPAFVRILATISAGMAMYAGKYATEKVDQGFWVRPVTYIGDASYSIYLVHWPVIVFCKYFVVFETTPLIIMLIGIFALSLLTHHLFEKPVGQLTLSRTATISAFIYILAIYASLYSCSSDTSVVAPTVTKNVTLSPAELAQENQRISKSCDNKQIMESCNWDPEMLKIYPKSKQGAAYTCSYSGNGTATVFFTGNSYALKQLPAIQKYLNGNFKKLYFVARPACGTFDRYHSRISAHYLCPEIKGKIDAFLKEFRPDVMIISQMLPFHDQTPKGETREQTVKHLENYMKMFANYTKAVIHIEPHQQFSFSPPQTIARHLSQGKPLDSLQMSAAEYNKTVDPDWVMVLKAMESCPTCYPVHIRQAFCSNGKCPAYDAKTKLSLFCDRGHFSYVALERLIPLLKEVLDPIMKRVST